MTEEDYIVEKLAGRLQEMWCFGVMTPNYGPRSKRPRIPQWAPRSSFKEYHDAYVKEFPHRLETFEEWKARKLKEAND